MGNPVTHFEVVGRDAGRLQNFYGKAFHWETADDGLGYAMAFPGAGSINGGVGIAPDGGDRVTFYIEVPDLERTLTEISALGGHTILPPTDVPGGPSIALFADPEGHTVGLVRGEATQ